jgi:hypothetical protein
MGISSWRAGSEFSQLSGHAWRLPAGFELPPEVVLVQNVHNGQPNDWLWTPSDRMTLEEFVEVHWLLSFLSLP